MNLPKKKTQVLSEEELNNTRLNHEYSRKKILLDFFLVILILSVAIVFVITIYRIFTDESARNAVTDIVISSVPGIIFFALAMFGIQRRN